MKHRLLALAVLPFLAFSGCVEPSGDLGGNCSLSLRIVLSAERRSLVPAFDMTPASYGVTATGPEGRTAEGSTVGSSVTLSDLAAGDWTVAVEARNGEGTAIGSGAASVTLAAGDEKELSIAVSPLAGHGTLDLAVLWTAAAVPAPSLRCLLVPAVGASLEMTFTLAEGSGSCLRDDVPAGWYTLELTLASGGAAVTGAAEAVRIVQGRTTAGSFDFTEATAAASVIAVNLIPAPQDPLSVVLSGGWNEMGAGGTCPFKALVDGAAGSARWYLDGLRVAEGPSFSLGPGVATGLRRVDAVAVSADPCRAGSAGRLVRVLESLPQGSVSWSAMLQDGLGGVDGLSGCRSVCLSPDGRSLYAAGTAEDSLAWMDRDPDTGALSYRGRLVNGTDGISGLGGVECAAVSPDGAFVYAGGALDGALAVFRRDSATGSLSFVSSVVDGAGGVDGLAGVRAVAVSPDGLDVYAAGYSDNAVAWFRRDPQSGVLVFGGCLKDGEGGVALLAGASSVAVSPDGSAVFAASYTDDALLVFSRDASTGGLAPASAFQDGAGGVDGLNGASCVVSSPDGTALFVASYYDSALAVFLREPLTGSVSFSCMLKDGTGGVDGLHYSRGCAVSADGRNVYVAGGGEDALAAFSVDPGAGAVSFLSVRRGGAGGVQGLDGVRGCAVSADGRNLYAAGTGENCVVVFGRVQ